MNALTADEQKDAAESLAHEIGMLVILPQYIEDSADKFCCWACLEAFLVHVRLLDDFFFHKPGNDDICAEHLVPTWLPPTHTKPILDSNRGRINKMLAHFTRARQAFLASGKTSWNHRELRAALLPVVQDFLTQATCVQGVIDKRLREKFDLSIKQIAELCKKDAGNALRSTGTGSSSTQTGPGATPNQPPTAPYCRPPSSGGTTTSGTYVKPKPPGQNGP